MKRPIRPASLAPVVLAVCAALTVAACGGSSTPISPSLNIPFSATDLRVGTGADAAPGRQLTVNYTGWLYDPALPDQKGRQFDSSLQTGRQPLPFVLGAGQVIRGWDQGFGGMKVGGLRRLVIPPELAYGSAGSQTIPPNATLIFEIDLLGVQ